MARAIDKTPEAREERVEAAKDIPLTKGGKSIAIVVTGAKGTGVVEVNRETGELGGSTFVRDILEGGREVRNIGVLPSERRRFEGAQSKEEREFAARQKEEEKKEAIKLRAEELERESQFLPPEQARIKEAQAQQLREQLPKEVTPTTSEEFQQDLLRRQRESERQERIRETIQRQEAQRIEEAQIIAQPQPIFITSQEDLTVSGLAAQQAAQQIQQTISGVGQPVFLAPTEDVRIPPGEIRAEPPLEGLEKAQRQIAIEAEKVRKQIEEEGPGPSLAIQETLLGFGSEAVFAAQLIGGLFTQPVETFKQIGGSLKEGGRRIITGEGFPEVGQTLRTQPGLVLGAIAFEAVEVVVGGFVLDNFGRVANRIRTRLSPKFRGVDTSALGEKIIRNIPDVQKIDDFEIGLIPPGKGGLDVDVKRFIRETVDDIPLKDVPDFPATNRFQREILRAVADEDDLVTGSFAQATLIKKSRGFADIDIASDDINKIAANIKNRLGDSVEIKDVRITDSPLGDFTIKRVIDKKTGKVLADLDPKQFAEEGLLASGKVSVTDVDGIKLVNPEVRLESKLEQLARGKNLDKVVIDIDLITGGTQNVGKRLESPLVRGAFGFTPEEQSAFIGRKGIVTTSARDLFDDFSGRAVIRPGGLFGTPEELGTGRALTRTTRLGLEQRTATLGDIIRGDITFKRTKPQIVFFEGEGINRAGGFQSVVFSSSELEVILPEGKIIRKGKVVAVTTIKGKRVPIISADIVDASDETAKLLAKKVLTAEDVAELRKRLSKESGFDVSSHFDSTPLVPPGGIGLGIAGAVSGGVGQPSFVQPSVPISVPPITTVSVPSPTTPISAPSVPPSQPTFIQPSPPISVPPSAPPSAAPSVPPSAPPSAAPSVPPSAPPSVPPSGLISAPPSVPPSVPPSFPPVVPPLIPLPPTPEVKPPKPPTPEQPKVEGYDVLIRKGAKRGDKFVLALENLPENMALLEGREATDNFIEASFRIQKSGQMTELPDIRKPNLDKFRSPVKTSRLPPDTLIEKRGNRLDTPGEVKQISFFKRQQAKRKRELKRQIEAFKRQQAQQLQTTIQNTANLQTAQNMDLLQSNPNNPNFIQPSNPSNPKSNNPGNNQKALFLLSSIVKQKKKQALQNTIATTQQEFNFLTTKKKKGKRKRVKAIKFI